MQNEEFIMDFVTDAKKHLKNIEEILINVEEVELKNDEVEKLLRLFHSIKGTAVFFSLDKIVDLSNSVEEVLQKIKNEDCHINNEIINLFLVAHDVLYRFVNDIRNSENYSIEEVIIELNNILHNKQINEKKTNKKETNKIVNNNKINIENNKLMENEKISVDISTLNELFNYTGEMVVYKNRLFDMLRDHYREINGLGLLLQNIDRATRGLQDNIMKTRMQSVKIILNKFPSITREFSRQLNKEIKLKIYEKDIYLDRAVIEVLEDPLTQIIRNSAVHGLEDSIERLNNNKTEHGNISIKAYYKSGLVYIDILDDGKGIDIEKIKKVTVERDILSPLEVKKLSEEEIIKIIFKPGFSTESNVTKFSGRGVGMDVVKTNIEKIGGKIEVYSKKGIGTTVRFVLPIKISIIKALIVDVNKNIITIPQNYVLEVIKIIDENYMEKIVNIKNEYYIRYRDKLIQIVDSYPLIKEKKDLGKYNKILIIKNGNGYYGLSIDDALDIEDIIVKPLPFYIKDCDFYSGVTILKNGMVSLILDPNGVLKSLSQSIKNYELTNNNDFKEKISSKKLNEKNDFKVLAFICDKKLFGIDMSKISHLDNINFNEIKNDKNSEFVNHKGKILKLVKLNSDYSCSKKKYLVFPKENNDNQTILVDEIVGIYDNKIINVEKKFGKNNYEIKGILENKIIRIIDIYDLLRRQ
ncbi:MAG: chemotaxis protein CheW [Clostridiales bacterium]